MGTRVQSYPFSTWLTASLMQTGNFSSSVSFFKSRSPLGKVFSWGLVFSVSEPEPDGQGDPAESSVMVGLGAPDIHFSCSSVIFMKGSRRFMRETYRGKL
ncbi:hypothetical protein FKM82_028116 [Ascaphus truei]